MNKESKMNRYHFSLGNSTDGPVGYCASVQAQTPEDAVKLLQGAIENFGGESIIVDPHHDETPLTGSDYVAVYLNSNCVTIADIDFWTDEEGDEYGEFIEGLCGEWLTEEEYDEHCSGSCKMCAQPDVYG